MAPNQSAEGVRNLSGDNGGGEGHYNSFPTVRITGASYRDPLNQQMFIGHHPCVAAF